MNNLRTPEQLHEYQRRAANHQCTHPQTALWLDPGLGKTATTLTSIVHLLNCKFLNAVLILAPIRVCRLVWRQEALKWSHSKHLKFSMVMGTRDQRTRALLQPADVYVTNYENLKWLSEVLHTYFISKDKPLPFNGVVFDEVSKCKTSTTDRVKSYMKIQLGLFFYLANQNYFPFGSPTWNRTTNRSLEGYCYIHLTMRPYL